LRSSVLPGCALVATLLAARTASAAGPGTACAPIDGGSPALEEIDAEARLAFIRHVLRDQASRADAWRWSWTGIGFGLAAGQYAEIAILPHDKVAQQLFLGTASLYIPLSMNVFPLRIRRYDEILERAAADAEVSQAHMTPCLVLDHAEEMLETAAKDEAQLTGAFMQVVTLVLNSAYTAIIAVAFRDLGTTLLNGIGAFVVGEAEIFTTPRGAIRALERYRSGELGAAYGAPAPRVSWSIGPLGSAPGLAVVATF
jgi:hypothetical protein